MNIHEVLHEGAHQLFPNSKIDSEHLDSRLGQLRIDFFSKIRF